MSNEIEDEIRRGRKSKEERDNELQEEHRAARKRMEEMDALCKELGIGNERNEHLAILRKLVEFQRDIEVLRRMTYGA